MQPINSAVQNNFNEAYKNLNEQQRKAVDSIEGPVMVIAGPDTGKTQILAVRIGKIIIRNRCIAAKYFMPYLYRCSYYYHTQTIVTIYWC